MTEETPKPKKSKALLFGIVGALVLGGGGGFATYSGMISLPIPGISKPEVVEAEPKELGTGRREAAYVQLDPIMVDFGRAGRSGRLRLSLTIETTKTAHDAVEDQKYRIADTLNSFLRAVREADLREPSKIELIRSRLLRRVLLETPPGSVSDVLISELVIL